MGLVSRFRCVGTVWPKVVDDVFGYLYTATGTKKISQRSNNMLRIHSLCSSQSTVAQWVKGQVLDQDSLGSHHHTAILTLCTFAQSVSSVYSAVRMSTWL